MQTIINILTYIIDIVFPKECTGCHTRGTFLCANCLGEVPPATKVEHSFIKAVFDYRNPVLKQAIWKFKYEHARELALIFAPYLYDEIIGTLGDTLDMRVSEKFLLVPIPLHAERFRERWYNQSALLVKELLKLDSASLFEESPEVLVRTRATKPQAKSERRATRLANLKGAFVCDEAKRIRGRIVILIDDVTTTGATLVEAKHALSKGKPRKILAFTVAH